MINPNREAGLESLNTSRRERHRRITTGKATIGGIPPKLFLWGLGFLVLSGILYFRNHLSETEIMRNKLMAKQRAIAQQLSPKLIPLRDRIEQAARELAASTADDKQAGVNFKEVLRESSVYLRLRAEDVRETKTLRKAATESLRDGFTSCFIRGERPKTTHGPVACEKSKQCESGEICSEYGQCQLPSSPFNARLLYRGLLVLSEQWVDEVEKARNEIALSAYEGTLDSVTEVDIPAAIEVYQRARYLIIVLDEDPDSGIPESIPHAFESKTERVQRVGHPARVGIWDLKTGSLLARQRGLAEGLLREVGTRHTQGSLLNQAALSRQANSCALATTVRADLLADQ